MHSLAHCQNIGLAPLGSRPLDQKSGSATELGPII